jgi:hypothetical protein
LTIPNYPSVLRAHNAQKARFIPRTLNHPRKIPETQYFIERTTVHPTGLREKEDLSKIPKEYEKYKKVFNKEKSQWLPSDTIWDHAIELLPNAPATLPARLLPLNQKEQEEMEKFMEEHLSRGTIQQSWSPYAANFFFIKKKDGKLRPVQDYRPINKWTKKNRNVSPLIPQTIDRLSECILFTKFDVR